MCLKEDMLVVFYYRGILDMGEILDLFSDTGSGYLNLNVCCTWQLKVTWLWDWHIAVTLAVSHKNHLTKQLSYITATGGDWWSSAFGDIGAETEQGCSIEAPTIFPWCDFHTWVIPWKGGGI